MPESLNNIALIIDAVFVIAFAVIIIVNTVRGFVKAFMQLGSSIVSMIFAGLFSKKLGAFLNERFLMDWVNDKIADAILNQLPQLDAIPDGVTVTINDLLVSLTGKFSLLLSVAGVNMAELSGAYGAMPATEENILLMVQHIGGNLSSMLATGLAFVLIFVAGLILFALITSLLNAATNLPVLKTANRILGLVFGVLIALVIGSVCSFVVTKAIEIVSIFSEEVGTLHIVENSYILRFFDKYNLLTLLIDALLN
ncbi:MAG: CvpA family protein [Clostridia bacterium]|nr:CvpA family protein [Clostridia bacterium]